MKLLGSILCRIRGHRWEGHGNTNWREEPWKRGFISCRRCGIEGRIHLFPRLVEGNILLTPGVVEGSPLDIFPNIEILRQPPILTTDNKQPGG